MQPYARNSFWICFHITVNRATSSSCSSCQGVCLICWEWHSAMLSHMKVWITRSWVCRKWGGEGSSEAMLVWQVHRCLVTVVIKMDTACVMWQQNPQVFNPVFWEAQSRKKDLKYRADQPCCLLSNPISCSAQHSCKFFLQNMLYNRFKNHVAKQSNAMEEENETVRYLWCYANGFTKDIHEALVAQIQKKITQYEIGSLSPFWELFSQHFASKVCWFCTSTSASASFQIGSMLWVLLTAGSFSNVSNSPTYSLDRSIATDAGRKRSIWSPFYLVTDWHGMSPLETGIRVKKPKKPSFHSLSLSFILYLHSVSSDPCWSSKQAVFWVYTTLCFTQKLITAEQSGCNAYSHSSVSPTPQTNHSGSARRMQTKIISLLVLLPHFPFSHGASCLRRLRHFRNLCSGLIDGGGWSRKSTIHAVVAGEVAQALVCM